MEDVNNEDGVSAVKYNECWRQVKVHKEEAEWRVWEEAEQIAWEEVEWRVEVERCKAKEQAKKRVSLSPIHLTELIGDRWRRLLCNSAAKARSRCWSH